MFQISCAWDERVRCHGQESETQAGFQSACAAHIDRAPSAWWVTARGHSLQGGHPAGGTGSASGRAASRRTSGLPACGTRAARRACWRRSAPQIFRRTWRSCALAARGQVLICSSRQTLSPAEALLRQSSPPYITVTMSLAYYVAGQRQLTNVTLLMSDHVSLEEVSVRVNRATASQHGAGYPPRALPACAGLLVEMADSVTVDRGVEALRRAASPPARPVLRRAASPVHRRAVSPVHRRAASPMQRQAPVGRGLTFEEREALRRGQLPGAAASPPGVQWGARQEPNRHALLHVTS